MGGKVTRNDAIDKLAGDEGEERAAIAEINREAVKKVRSVHRRCNDRSRQKHMPVIAVRLERVEERDSLHCVTPLRLAGPVIYREVSRPVNGRADRVRHLGRTIERDFGAEEVKIGVQQRNGDGKGNDYVGYGGSSPSALRRGANKHQWKRLPSRDGGEVEMRDGDDAVRRLASRRHRRCRCLVQRRQLAVSAEEAGLRTQLVQFCPLMDKLVEFVLGLGAEFFSASGLH